MRKRRFGDDDWTTILSLPEGIPKRLFPFVTDAFKDSLFSLSENVFAIICCLPHLDDESPENTERIASVYWARNNYAVEAIVGMRSSISQRMLSQGDAVPPVGLMLDGMSGWRNKDTYTAAKRQGNAFSERATYGANGNFLYKVVSVFPLQIYYTSRLKNDNELPFAVEVILGSVAAKDMEDRPKKSRKSSKSKVRKKK